MTNEIDAPANDIIAMNLTIAVLDRWVANVSPSDDDEEEDDEDDDDVIEARIVAV